MRGELIDEQQAVRVGKFYAAGFALGGGSHPAHGERLELHTFKLRDGTIIGSGTAGQLEGVFAILGGTGRYAGARGRTSRASVIRTSAETGPRSSC